MSIKPNSEVHLTDPDKLYTELKPFCPSALNVNCKSLARELNNLQRLEWGFISLHGQQHQGWESELLQKDWKITPPTPTHNCGGGGAEKKTKFQ